MQRHLIRGLFCFVLAMPFASASGPFPRPSEGPVPFRRDRLPLDVDTMTGLSRHMLLMAKTLGLESAAARHASAQSLALAIALDPANREARELLNGFSEDHPSPAPDATETESAKARIWQIISWLENSEAGADGQALGLCLSDTMTSADPSHPKSEARRGKGDSGEWTGWVPGMLSYEEKAIAKVPDETTPEKPVAPMERPEAGITRSAAMVSTPLWTYDKDSDKLIVKPMVISMKAWIESEGNDQHGFGVRLENTEGGELIHQTGNGVVAALKDIGDQFPKGGVVSLTIGKGEDYLVSKNRQTLSAAATVLVDSAVSTREPSATVMGIVQPDGSLKMPTRAWDKLRALSAGPGGRLVLPREAEALLPSILAIEDAAFFMKYEVVLADNLKELVEYSAKAGTGELADASVKFAGIRDKMGSNAVTQYVANRYVRQRLGEIAQACPDHLSARMLFIQGGGERPSRLPKQILASEIRRALEPMTALPADWNDNLDANLIDATHEKCRALLDPLERYVDIRDRDFYGHAKNLLTTVRTLGRVKRTARDNFDNGNTNRKATEEAFGIVRTTYAKLRAELAEVANDDEPKEPQRDGRIDRFPGGPKPPR